MNTLAYSYVINGHTQQDSLGVRIAYHELLYRMVVTVSGVIENEVPHVHLQTSMGLSISSADQVTSLAKINSMNH